MIGQQIKIASYLPSRGGPIEDGFGEMLGLLVLV